MVLNSTQSNLEDLKVDNNPKEVIEQFYDFFNNIPFIKSITKVDRKKAKDLPRDEEGKIKVNITEPHILEDMNYFRPSAIHFQKYGCYTKLRPNPNPNSEYGKWIRTEIKRCWYGYIRPSDGEWITGDYYYYLNYCPIQLIKKLPNGQSVRTIDFPRVWDGQYLVHHYLYNARLHGHHASELASRGKGKAHPYNEIVYTLEGKKQWKDIQVGDYLFGDNGNLTKVLDIPFDDKAPIYEVELSSGHKIKCSEGHLWKVYSHCRGKIIVSTKELINLYKRPHKIGPHNLKGYELDCTIPKGEGAEFPYIPTKVDPYTFGLLLGDGSFRNPGYKNTVYFTAEDKDFEIYKTLIPYTINKVPSGKYTYGVQIQNIYKILDTYGLNQKKSEYKFIPEEYKYNSRAVRISLLKGLLDADGTVTNGKIELVLSSKRMVEDVRWICASLGIPCTDIRIKKTWYYGKNKERIECLDAYRLSIFSSINIFNLPRKTSQWANRSKTNYAQSKYKGYKITNITYLGEQQAKCVTVDNESHCYLINEFIVTHNSYTGAGLLAKRFKLGENQQVREKVQSVVTASDKKYIYGPNQILNMFKYYIDFQSQHTQFPRQLLTDSAQLLMWESGFKDKETGVRKGSQNAVIGVTTGVNQDKLNGSRGVLYLIEEAGIFSNLGSLYQMIRPSVEDGKDVYGLIFSYGTAGDENSNFTDLQEMMYNPDGYNMEKNINVWDKEGQGRKWFTFFYPAYLNRANCMDENGNSDVTKALLEICQDRYVVKYNSTDINAITKRISQYPITPQEAIIRAHSTIFPITELNERLNQIDNNPNFYNDTYIGNLVFNGNGEVEFVISDDKPIRDFPTKDNKITGAIEIYALPEKDSNGKVPNERYIAASDPYDDDSSNTMSLGSFFILDTWTDTIVMEYTGRPMFANDYFEICRKGCLFYNAKLMYEAHPYSQEVRLPNGETKLWKDIKIGDYLFAPNGNITKVIDIPMDGEDDIYRITLADGRQVEASSNHKWVVYKCNNKDKVYEVTTQEMYNIGIKNKYGQTNFFIPESGAVNYQYKKPIIDPYTLGLLIAEGALTKFKKNKYKNFKRNYVQISSSKEDMEIYKTLIPYPVKYIGTKGFSWHLYIEDIDLKMAELNLLHCNSHTKFIPSSYLVNSYKVRLQLLKGLMDGDGCATKSGAAVYITTSEKLAKDVTILCRSLGIKASISEPKKSVYRVTIISTISVFNLPRKQKKQHIYTPYTKGSKASAYLYKTAIQNIEYIGRQKCKCITVDRTDGLYLIGDYITTHNCNKKGLFAYFSMMNSSYLLATTPNYLKDKQLIKDIGYGNKAFGINATTAIKGYGYQKIREWLLQPYTKIERDSDGNDVEIQQANLYRLKNRALIKELILWNPDINVDRIMAMVQLMLYREEKMILYEGNMSSSGQDVGSELADDPYFTQNYDLRYKQ